MNSYKKPSCDTIYNLPEIKNNKYATMGFGFRKEFINKKEAENTPSPQQYELKSIFLENLKKERGCSLAQKINYKEGEPKNFPGPTDYNNNNAEWYKKTPCSMKFRKDFFYIDDVKKSHNVSPMKYLPKTKMTENNRFRNNSISFGIGLRNYEIIEAMDKIPGPGRYNLPSVFDKLKTGKIPLN